MTRLLLIDDDAAGLEIRKLVLERHGYEVSVAASAGAASALFQTLKPAVVILDLRIPELEDGLSLIREFRVASPEVRLVVVSGWIAALDGLPEALMVDHLLSKPVRSERLLEALAS